MVIIMDSPQDLAEATITDENRPDIIIHEFRELLDIFPDRPVPRLPCWNRDYHAGTGTTPPRPETGTTPREPGLRRK
jgi:hypothetical protein